MILCLLPLNVVSKEPVVSCNDICLEVSNGEAESSLSNVSLGGIVTGAGNEIGIEFDTVGLEIVTRT